MWSHSSHWLLDSVPDEQSDLSCPWKSRCCVMYSEVDSLFFFVLWILTTFPPPLSLYVSALLDIILPITFHNSNHHVSCGETKLWETVKDRNSAGNVVSISSNQLGGQCFFSCGGGLAWCQILRSNELKQKKCAQDRLCLATVAEEGVNVKTCWIHKEAAVFKSMSTYLNLPTIPWYEYICQLQLPLCLV